MSTSTSVTKGPLHNDSIPEQRSVTMLTFLSANARVTEM
jgi:hypothetical protein